MRFSFDSVDEIRNFVKTELKAKRGGTAADDGETGGAIAGNMPGNGQAPAPQMPSAQQLQQATAGAGVAGGSVGMSAAPGAFPGGGMPTIDPAVAGLVQRIIARADAAVVAGQPAAGIEQWFRNACATADPNAANADLATLKAAYLPKIPIATLDAMAKQMGA